MVLRVSVVLWPAIVVVREFAVSEVAVGILGMEIGIDLGLLVTRTAAGNLALKVGMLGMLMLVLIVSSLGMCFLQLDLQSMMSVLGSVVSDMRMMVLSMRVVVAVVLVVVVVVCYYTLLVVLNTVVAVAAVVVAVA